MVYKILLIQVFQWLLNIGANARCSPERIKLSSHWSPHGTPLMKKTTSSAQLLHLETGFWEAPFEPTFAVSFAAAVETTALNELWLWRQMLMLKREVTADKKLSAQHAQTFYGWYRLCNWSQAHSASIKPDKHLKVRAHVLPCHFR